MITIFIAILITIVFFWGLNEIVFRLDKKYQEKNDFMLATYRVSKIKTNNIVKLRTSSVRVRHLGKL